MIGVIAWIAVIVAEYVVLLIGGPVPDCLSYGGMQELIITRSLPLPLRMVLC